MNEIALWVNFDFEIDKKKTRKLSKEFLTKQFKFTKGFFLYILITFIKLSIRKKKMKFTQSVTNFINKLAEVKYLFCFTVISLSLSKIEILVSNLQNYSIKHFV